MGFADVFVFVVIVILFFVFCFLFFVFVIIVFVVVIIMVVFIFIFIFVFVFVFVFVIVFFFFCYCLPNINSCFIPPIEPPFSFRESHLLDSFVFHNGRGENVVCKFPFIWTRIRPTIPTV